jgi:ligand-binding sensor domain-containing protein/signal transduction histidine kinase
MRILLKSNKVRCILLMFCIIGYSIRSTYAQNNDIRFNHYTVENGLSQNSVFSILQDHHGFMWFGTRTSGLNKFNGYSFITYKRNVMDSLSISGNEILALCEDKYGMLWIGTRNDGVNRFDENTNRFYAYFSSSNDSATISSKTTNTIYEDPKGNLWFGTNYGLCMYNRDQDNFIWHANNKLFKSVHIKIIKYAGENLLWIGSRNGLYLYNTQTRKILKHFVHDENNPTSLSDSYITALTIDVNGLIWVATYRSGLNRLDDTVKGVFTHFKSDSKNKNSLLSNAIRTLHLDKKGVLWVGTKKGLEKIYPDQQKAQNPVFKHYQNDENNPYSLNQNSIYSFYEGKDDNIWIGTYFGGVNQIYNGPNKFNHISRLKNNPNSLSSNVINSFIETEDGMWIATEGGGLNLYNPKTGNYKVFRMNTDDPYSLKSNDVKNLYVDTDGDLWVGTFNGLHFYNRKLNRFYNYIEGREIYTIVEGLQGEIWVGTNQDLFKVKKSDFSIKEFNAERNEKRMSSKDINKIFKDSKERIWIGSKTGLYKYNRQQDNFERFTHDKQDNRSISNSHCTCISEDKSGNIWIGTMDGLNRFDEKNGVFVHFNETAGLPDNVISNLLFDDAGQLWLTTNNGLSKLNIENLFSDDQLLNSSKKNTVRNYDTEDGLQNMEFRLNSSFKNQKGELFFGGINGYNFFHPDSVKDNPHVPQVVITAFKLFLKEVKPGDKDSPITEPIWLTKKIILNHKQSVVSFEFAALNYTTPSKNQYAYILEGYDENWNYIGAKHEATYTSLPAGNYVFKVKASNNDGLWNDTGVSLEIKVTPPIWGKWWFRIVSAVLFFLLIALYYTVRLIKEKQTNRRLELKVQERTAELREKNKLLSEKTNILNESNSILVERQKLIEKQTEEIKSQRNELAEANIVKDKLFSVIAHDLRSPFNSVLGFSELLVLNHDVYKDDEKLACANTIYESSTIIFNLIDSLLLWSRSQMENIKPSYKLCDFCELIKENIKLAELQAKPKNILIKNNTQSEEIRIHLDADLINTVIRNLISNAIKFTNQGGEIIISCKIEEDKIIVSFKDNGVGISKEAQSKIFKNNTEYICNGTNNEKGTGFGLLICSDFIKLHKGKIWVKSEQGNGAEFSFSLPFKGHE